jgi:ATP-dependent RNA helicase RhlB
MTVLKALKKMFGKSEAEPLAPVPSAPVDARQPPRCRNLAGRACAAPNRPGRRPRPPKPAEAARQRRAKATPRAQAQAAGHPWKLEDFVVEPQEGKTRFHDFKLAPELMHAIQDLGFPYCTPIQAQVLGFTLAGKDAIGRARPAPARPPRS